MNPFMNLWSGPSCWLPPVLLAPFIGSFLGTLIVRLPAGRPIALARSACDQCGHRLAARDLVPVLSFALSRGHCRHCGGAIGPFPLAIELAATAVAVWAVLAVPCEASWPSCVFGWTLLTLAWIDARTMLLPDVLTLPLLGAGLISAWIGGDGTILDHAILDHALGAAAGYGCLFAVAEAYRRLRGRDGLGLGDAKLLGAIGAWLGLAPLPLVLFLGACLGLAAAGLARLAGRPMTRATAIPFGPFLALAGWLTWLHGDWLMEQSIDRIIGG